MSSATLPQVAWAGSLVASGLLAVSGALKVRNPDSVVPLLAALHVPRLLQRGRVVGIAELALGAGAGVSSYRLALATEGAVYVSFALVIGYVLVARVPLASCGCSGRQQTPPSVLHVGLNLAAASAAFIGAALRRPHYRLSGHSSTFTARPWQSPLERRSRWHWS